MNKKGVGLMDALCFALAVIFIVAIITFIYNPFDVLGWGTVRSLLGL